MKKLFVLLMILMALSLAACGEKQTSAAAKPVSEPTPVSEVAPTPAPVSTPVEPAPAPESAPISVPTEPTSEPAPASEPEPVSEPTPEPIPVSEPEPTPTPSDPYAMLEVSLDWAKQHPQVYVKKANGKIYATSDVPVENRAIGAIGMNIKDVCEVQRSMMSGTLIVFGDFPILTVEDGDELISTGFDSTKIQKIDMQNAGYTFPLNKTTSGGAMLDAENGTAIVFLTGTEKQLEIHDEKGNLLSADGEDRFHLERGTKITISWFSGTNYQEQQTVANCRCITKTMRSGDLITLNGILDKAGYAKYDISSFEPGDYYVDTAWIHIG